LKSFPHFLLYILQQHSSIITQERRIYTALRWAKRLLLEGIVRHRNKSPKRNGACIEKRAATAKEKEYKRENPGPASQQLYIALLQASLSLFAFFDAAADACVMSIKLKYKFTSNTCSIIYSPVLYFLMTI
jgi:hypothetical protein